MNISVDKNFKKTKKIYVPGNEHIWFEVEPITKKEKLKLLQACSSPVIHNNQVMKSGRAVAKDFNFSIYHEGQLELLNEKIKNFGGIEDKETKKQLEFSKANLKILLESAWDTFLHYKTDEDGKEIIDEDTKEKTQVVLGDWIFNEACEVKNIEGDIKN